MTQNASPAAATDALTCPQCKRPVPRDAMSCPHCGVDLMLVALLAERASLVGLPEAAPIPSTPEALVPRIGEYLVNQGLLSEDQLQVGLKRQAELSAKGDHRLLGKTLVELGLVDRETLDRAVTGQIIELHAALQDANRTLERRVSERTIELRRALERLTELNQLKANLISNVSHELRTPLAQIKGYVELLVDSKLGPNTPEQEKALKVMVRATDRLGRLIEDLIEFSSASRQGMALKVQPVNLAALVEDVIRRSEEKSVKASVTVSGDIDKDVPALNADPDRLGWVLFQLVDNGIKFTPAGGSVTVTAKLQDELVTILVRDTGIGIPKNRLPELFQAFHQLDGSTTRRYGGTGLGLALVKVILDAHGSSVEVESEEGAGTSFAFVLPLAPGKR